MKNITIISKKCLECGDLFCKKQTESGKYWKTKKYCSTKCSLIHTTVKKQRNSNKPSLGIEPWNKGKPYSSKMKSRLNMSGLKLGSLSLKGKKRPDMQGENNPTWKPKMSKPCKVCQKEMLLPPWDRNRKFCGRVCWALGTRGKGSPVYKGTKSVARLRNRIAQMPEYREWHAKILKRDDYKCTMCGCVHTKNTPLEVDHIKRFLYIAKENKILSPEDARNCTELWDTNNGRAVCRPCHRTTDTYGTKNLSA